MFDLKNLARTIPPRLPWQRVKEVILGKKYYLSLVFIGEKRAHRLNVKYRKKNNPTNVLAFPLNKSAGELFLNLGRIKSESKAVKMSYKAYASYIFIHGLLHLDGYSHGSTMEREERKLMKAFRF